MRDRLAELRQRVAAEGDPHEDGLGLDGPTADDASAVGRALREAAELWRALERLEQLSEGIDRAQQAVLCCTSEHGVAQHKQALGTARATFVCHALALQPRLGALSAGPARGLGGTGPTGDSVGTGPIGASVGTDPIRVSVGTGPTGDLVGTDPIRVSVGTGPIGVSVGTGALGDSVCTDPIGVSVGAGPRVRQAQLWLLLRRFGAVLARHYARESRYRRRLREQIQRQAELAGIALGARDVERLADSPEVPRIVGRGLAEPQARREQQLGVARAQWRQLRELETQMAELRGLFLQLQGLLAQQQGPADSLEQHVLRSLDSAAQGEVRRARRCPHRSRLSALLTAALTLCACCPCLPAPHQGPR